MLSGTEEHNTNSAFNKQENMLTAVIQNMHIISVG